MSSNAALSAARRRRSNPSAAVPSSTNMQSHVPPANRIIQRTGPLQPQQLQPQPQQPQFNSRMPTPSQQPQQMQGRMQPPVQPQSQMRVPPPPHQVNGRYQGQGQGKIQPQPQSMMQHPPSSQSFPPLPPPVKTAGPLYGIPIHPLMMFKTHDNKLSEHDLIIDDCFEQLKGIDERLTVIESSTGLNGNNKGIEHEESATGVGDLNDLMNDEVFINGVVDNIMNTTNFASIVENVIPLKEENEALKQQVQGLHDQVQVLHNQLEEWKERMQHIENHMHSFSSCVSNENVVQLPVVVLEQVENVDSTHAEETTSCNEEGEDDDHSDEE